jgi:hypothetical protein
VFTGDIINKYRFVLLQLLAVDSRMKNDKKPELLSGRVDFVKCQVINPDCGTARMDYTTGKNKMPPVKKRAFK